MTDEDSTPLAIRLKSAVTNVLDRRMKEAGLGDDSDPIAIQIVLDEVSTEVNNFINQGTNRLPPIKLTLTSEKQVIIDFTCSRCLSEHPELGKLICKTCASKKSPAEVIKNISEMVRNDSEVQAFVKRWGGKR